MWFLFNVRQMLCNENAIEDDSLMELLTIMQILWIVVLTMQLSYIIRWKSDGSTTMPRKIESEKREKGQMKEMKYWKRNCSHLIYYSVSKQKTEKEQIILFLNFQIFFGESWCLQNIHGYLQMNKGKSVLGNENMLEYFVFSKVNIFSPNM